MTAFTDQCARRIRLMGTKGEIKGDMDAGTIEIRDFVSGNLETIELHTPANGHNGSDNCAYRPDGELEEWKKKDPLKVFKDRGYLTDEELKAIEKEVDAEIEKACEFAAESPYPDASELMTDIFVD